MEKDNRTVISKAQFDQLLEVFRIRLDLEQIKAYIANYDPKDISIVALKKGLRGTFCPEESPRIVVSSLLDDKERIETLLHEILHAYECDKEISIPHPMIRLLAVILT